MILHVSKWFDVAQIQVTYFHIIQLTIEYLIVLSC